MESLLNDGLPKVIGCLIPLQWTTYPYFQASRKLLRGVWSLVYESFIILVYGLLRGASDARQDRLRSRCPFVLAAQNLLNNLARLGIRSSEWTNHKWKTEYCENASRLHVFYTQNQCQACWDELAPNSLG